MFERLKEKGAYVGERALHGLSSVVEKRINPEAAERMLQWIDNAIERQFKTENFIVANLTPFEVIHRSGLLSLRKYATPAEDEIPLGGGTMPVRREQYRVPLLLVPPLAADPLNFDLFPDRSLVRFLSASGFRVYLADFGSPGREDSHLSLQDYATRMLPEAIAKVREDSGEQDVSLLGYCMGGLFCLVYAGWSGDARIRNIVTIASPIDIHQANVAGKLGQAMQTPFKLARRFTGIRIHKLNPDHLQMPGWMSSLIFKMTDPMGTVRSYLDLLVNLWDREYVTRHQTMSTWFNKMHAYPGGIVQDFMVRVGVDNALSKGQIGLGREQEQSADLNRICCSLLAIAGESDQIVAPEAARRIMDVVASPDKTFELAPGGHAGVFAGSKAPATSWRAAADWLATRSDGPAGKSNRAASVKKKRAAKRAKSRAA